MELYKIGKIVSVGKTYIIIECNFTGLIVYVASPKVFEKDKIRKVYIYIHKSEYSEAMYGFSSFKERILFEDLISINGIGPKTSLNLLKHGQNKLINLIISANVQGLANYPSIGTKSANQIIFELKDKYCNMKTKELGKHLPIDIKESLKTLGFNFKQINFAISKLKPSVSIEQMVEDAIRLISNAKFA